MYNYELFKREAAGFVHGLKRLQTLAEIRRELQQRVEKLSQLNWTAREADAHKTIRIRDCAIALRNSLSERSEQLSGFSFAKAIWDLSKNSQRPDLCPAFFAEVINWIKGLEGRADFNFLFKQRQFETAASGREKSVHRSEELDLIWHAIEKKMQSYSNGLSEAAVKTREERKSKIMQILRADEDDWNNWKWHVRNVVKTSAALRKITYVEDSQCRTIDDALKAGLPFGITPYYVHLMDDLPNRNDTAIRAQVLPTRHYVDHMLENRKSGCKSLDFMLESETSPMDGITRRYPGISIIKPVSTCPQICVYCQRNWEIEQVMAPDSFSTPSELKAAVDWIQSHPSIKEVLITGGDPLILSDQKLDGLLEKITAIDHVDLIRIGTRTPVTLPMRITNRLAGILGKYRKIGCRDIAVVTHIEHPYEITKETALAVENLKRQGISVYNQLVYTFYVSSRFLSTYLRMLQRRIGIDPYYTFLPKGKEETNEYRVPIPRILQEQKEEARLVPGLRRTDEAVFNVPGLGKNYLRAAQHRDLLTVVPDGGRVYEFHPWEMHINKCRTYIYKDIPVLDYLERLAKAGERMEDYDSIWFFI
jgi:lysine 2,3-aminomutase